MVKKIKETKKNYTLQILFVLALICLIWMGVSESNQDPETQIVPSYIETQHDILAKVVIPGPSQNTVQCYSDLYEEYVLKFDYQFYEIYDEQTFFMNLKTKDSVFSYRILMPELRSTLELSESKELKELSEELRHGHRIECRAYLLSGENDWKLEIYDNGYKQVKNLNLYIDFYAECINYPEENGFTCNYFTNYNNLEWWRIPEETKRFIKLEIE